VQPTDISSFYHLRRKHLQQWLQLRQAVCTIPLTLRSRSHPSAQQLQAACHIVTPGNERRSPSRPQVPPVWISSQDTVGTGAAVPAQVLQPNHPSATRSAARGANRQQLHCVTLQPSFDRSAWMQREEPLCSKPGGSDTTQSLRGTQKSVLQIDRGSSACARSAPGHKHCARAIRTLVCALG
jgi:hypothetical protein